MAALLFKLNNVPEDEAADIRQLLAEHDFHTYETQAGFWGLGVSAIWLVDKSQLRDARALIDDYQAKRSREQREAYAEREARGEVPTLASKIASNPLRFLAMIIAIIVVLGISIIPFLGLIAW
jgi:hypothetical protein